MSRKNSTQYWTPSQLGAVERATTFEEVGAVALEVALAMPGPFGQVCGNISNGGTASMEERERNLDRFDATIRKLHESGEVVYNQVPFEDKVGEIKRYDRDHMRLLETIYLPIFESGRVRRLYLMHGWKGSFGARWEVAQARRLDISLVELDADFLIEN